MRKSNGMQFRDTGLYQGMALAIPQLLAERPALAAAAARLKANRSRQAYGIAKAMP
jgi:hypothetical protein